MDITQLRALDEAGLRDRLVELRQDQFKFRMQRAAGQLNQPHLFMETRREIARVKTVLNEKQRNV